ncbi:hypothetical protein LJ737_06415 [Hymenobacter sp. 15J16-1T3B]|uniref:hypothetical protein n=1 Tax=Hymenobacter sp. 15J16-1T3B TaxID=2886941 RepID=UPI001D11C7DE|nr:hypothetical protein [Hymenobacter sp. 15J16-1T3B]MCC3156861.1 hypothetical protein [Hymenobacter sp. 15J16-1T3B]
MTRAQRWAAAWRRKRNVFYRRPDGQFIIQSRLPWWQAAAGTLGWMAFIGVQLPLPVPALLVAPAAAGVALAVWAGLFSRLEIGPAGVVLRAGGWFGRARRLPLHAVVLDATSLATGEVLPWAEANGRLHFEYASPLESDDLFLYITCQRKDLSHQFDDAFAWASLQQVGTALREIRAGGN